MFKIQFHRDTTSPLVATRTTFGNDCEVLHRKLMSKPNLHIVNLVISTNRDRSAQQQKQKLQPDFILVKLQPDLVWQRARNTRDNWTNTCNSLDKAILNDHYDAVLLQSPLLVLQTLLLDLHYWLSACLTSRIG